MNENITEYFKQSTTVLRKGYWIRAMVIKLQCASESPGGLVQTQIAGLQLLEFLVE